MRKYFLALTILCCCASPLLSQTKITGTVSNETGDKLKGASITIKGTSEGTTTDDKGNFSLTTSKTPPFDIIVSHTGFGNETISYKTKGQALSVSLKEDVLENAEVLHFFTEIFKARDPERFIDPDARELLIFNSGGVLRDLMSLSQTAIEEAYMDGSDLVTEQHANQAILAIERSKIIGLTDSSIEILSKVMTENLFSPRTSEDFDLLLTGHILEYRYPRRRFVVHPILVPILEKMVAGVANG